MFNLLRVMLASGHFKLKALAIHARSLPSVEMIVDSANASSDGAHGVALTRPLEQNSARQRLRCDNNRMLVGGHELVRLLDVFSNLPSSRLQLSRNLMTMKRQTSQRSRSAKHVTNRLQMPF